ncbi:MAG: hypothetical protein DSZ07_07445, partial [Sulfurovum sp.]
ELNAIRDVSGAVDGTDYSEALANGTYVDSSNPTAKEIQAVIDAKNTEVNDLNAKYSEIIKAIAGNGTAVTAEQINAIEGVSGAESGIDYSKALQLGRFIDPTKPTAEEIQAVVDAENISNMNLEKVIENIEGTTTVTAEELNSIRGISGAIDGIDYSEAIEYGTYADQSHPTTKEIQSVIDAKNTELNASNEGFAEVSEYIAGNSNELGVTAEQINSILGVSGAVEDIDYSEALQEGTFVDRENPTISEIQAVINVENISNNNLIKVADTIAGNGTVTASELNSIRDVKGAINGTDYTEALTQGTYEDPSTPRRAEIQAVIDSRNTEVIAENNELSELEPIIYSLGGEEKDPENIIHEIVEVSIPTVAKDIDVNSVKLEGADENGEVVVKGEGTWSVEDGKIVFNPEDGFVYDPSPIKYSMSREDGTQLAAQIIEVNYPGLLRDDIVVTSDLKDIIVIDVLKNDNGDLNLSTLKIIVPEGFMDEHPGSTFEKSSARSVKILNITGEGTWRALDNGKITYEPLTDSEPTPIEYEVYDNGARKVLSGAGIAIKKTEVAGVSDEASCEDYSTNSIPTLSKWGMGLTAILSSLFGILLFRKKKNKA